MSALPVVEVSGQPLTPVIRHGETVVYDSRAILRYLDSNFRGTPALLATDVPTMREMEQEENYARSTIAEPAGMVFAQAGAEEPDLEVCRQASQMIHEATAAYEERLGQHDYLMGDAMSVVDVTAAPFVYYATLPPEAAQSDMPIVSFFAQNYTIGEGREKTRDWVGRVMAFDR